MNNTSSVIKPTIVNKLKMRPHQTCIFYRIKIHELRKGLKASCQFTSLSQFQAHAHHLFIFSEKEFLLKIKRNKSELFRKCLSHDVF